jgi:hypothetical protein
MIIEQGDIVCAPKDPTGTLALVLTMPYLRAHDGRDATRVVDVLWTDSDYIMTCYVCALQIRLKRPQS